MATSLPWHPLRPTRTVSFCTPSHKQYIPIRRLPTVQAFRRNDFDRFAKRITSGETWRDVWRSANDSFEQLAYETKKTAERIDRQYSVSRRLSSVAQSAADRARVLDREFELSQRWRTFSLDFSRNWPRVWSFHFFYFHFHLQHSPFLV